MSIRVSCGNCQRKLKAPDKAAGKTLKCPDCGAGIQIPAADARGVGSNAPGTSTRNENTSPRCWDCDAEVSNSDVDCPECGAILNTASALRLPVDARKKRKNKKKQNRQNEAANKWRESLFGAFAFAFPAVLRGNGWLCCLSCAATMTALPIVPAIIGLPLICIPFIGIYLYLTIMFIIIAAAPAGILSRNMEISSRNGARDKMQHWEMSLTDEMIPASIELLKANAVLGLLPLLIAGVFAAVFGGFASLTPGSLDFVGQVGSVLTGLLYLFVALACSFCGPMCIMLLGAGTVEAAVYPPNVFRVMRRTFPQYLAFFLYVAVLAILTYFVSAVLATIILMIFGSVAAAWESGTFMDNSLFALASTAAWFVVCLFATYFSAVVGWSMGIFVYRNYEDFEVVTG